MGICGAELLAQSLCLRSLRLTVQRETEQTSRLILLASIPLFNHRSDINLCGILTISRAIYDKISALAVELYLALSYSPSTSLQLFVGSWPIFKFIIITS
jgi:hypothetical protein